MTLFEVIAEVVRVLADLIPRPQLILRTHRAVFFFFGRWPVEVGPGWYIAWPCFWSIEEYPTVRTTLGMSGQTLRTADGLSVIAAGVVVYQVPRIRSLVVETFEADEAISDMASAALAEVVTAHTVEELTEGEDVNELLTEAVEVQLKEFGVEVIRAVFTDFAEVIVLRNWQNENAEG